nr:DUF4446 family protein [uncultured Anaerotignum sp.]
MIELTQEMILILLGVLAVAVIVLFILCIVLFVKINKQKKRYDFFMGANRRPTHNLETKIEEYFETSKEIESKYAKLLDMVTDMDKTDKSKIQKVGLIRYNPFDEMGGNLCFALALLDGNDNGVVLNGIHSRTGSFTYAKPIEMGVSTYMLSEEEIKAVDVAKQNTYQPEHEKVVKVRFKPIFRKKDKSKAMEEQISLDDVQADEKNAVEQRQAKASIGDVTEAERALIMKEETLAGKIAAAETILKMREEAKAEAEKAHLPEEEKPRDTMEEAVERAIAEAKISEPIFQEAVFMEKQPEETDEENEK